MAAPHQFSNQKGQCNCGKIQFEINGPILFSGLCHCHSCSAARGVSPTHILGVPKDALKITKGEEFLKIVNGQRTVFHGFCSECGSHIHQYPQAAVDTMRAVLPASFTFEGRAPKDYRLPKELHPTAHLNYENRHRDYNDDTPKFLDFGTQECDCEGVAIEGSAAKFM